MSLDLKKYGQYKNDIFTKLDFNFEPGKKLLDVGCGDGSDAKIFINEYDLDVYGVDVYEHKDVKEILGDNFDLNKQGVFDLKYLDQHFDYIFMHDVLHHVDEEKQSYESHLKALTNLKKFIKPDGHIIIVEGTRYNPLFYPHMVKHLGHEHFSHAYFKKLIKDAYGENVEYKYFEAHLYPKSLLPIFKVYEWLMESFSPKKFLAYNVAITNGLLDEVPSS